MRFVHTSDLHLGRFYKGELPLEITKKRREELWMNFENIIDFCIKENIEILLLSGDLYERDYFTLNDINRFKELLDKLNYTKVFIIAGNHDYIDENSLYNKVIFKENVYIFKGEKFFDIDSLKLRVHGLSWDKDKNIDKKLDFSIKEDYKNIILLHGSVDMEDEYFPMTKKELEKLNADYIALGHIHLPQKILKNAYYPGSPEGLNFKEVGERGFILGEIEENLKIEFIKNNIRNYNIIDYNIEPNMTIYNIKEDILNLLENKKNDLNRIILKGEYKDIEYIEESLNIFDDYFYIELVNKLEEEISVDEIYKENRDNLIGNFIESTRDDADALKIGLKALLEAQNEN